MKITKKQLLQLINEYHPRPDDDYDPLNPDDDEDDAAYDQGFDDGFNGYPSKPVTGGDYHAGYEEGVNAAKDEASRAEHAEEFGPRREGKMKITKRQLRRIIKEEKQRLLREQRNTRFPGMTLQDFDDAIQRRFDISQREAENDPQYSEMMAEDAHTLQNIKDLAVDERRGGGEMGSRQLQDMVTYLDTAVREDIPPTIYYWIIGEKL